MRRRSFQGERYAREPLEYMPPRLCGEGNRRKGTREAVQNRVGPAIPESTYEEQTEAGGKRKAARLE